MTPLRSEDELEGERRLRALKAIAAEVARTPRTRAHQKRLLELAAEASSLASEAEEVLDEAGPALVATVWADRDAIKADVAARDGLEEG